MCKCKDSRSSRSFPLAQIYAAAYCHKHKSLKNKKDTDEVFASLCDTDEMFVFLFDTENIFAASIGYGWDFHLGKEQFAWRESFTLAHFVQVVSARIPSTARRS